MVAPNCGKAKKKFATKLLLSKCKACKLMGECKRMMDAEQWKGGQGNGYVYLLLGRIASIVFGNLLWLQCLQMIRQPWRRILCLPFLCCGSCVLLLLLQLLCCICIAALGRRTTYALQVHLACNELAAEIRQCQPREACRE